MFSDGALTVFGQTFGRVKSGSVTINNNITPNKKLSHSICDALLAEQPGDVTFAINKQNLSGGLTVSDDEEIY